MSSLSGRATCWVEKRLSISMLSCSCKNPPTVSLPLISIQANERPASTPWVPQAEKIFYRTLNVMDRKRIYMLQNVGYIEGQQKYTKDVTYIKIIHLLRWSLFTFKNIQTRHIELCKADRITRKSFTSGLEVIKATPTELALRLSLGLEPFETWGKLSPQGSPPLGGALSPQGSPPLEVWKVCQFSFPILLNLFRGKLVVIHTAIGLFKKYYNTPSCPSKISH